MVTTNTFFKRNAKCMALAALLMASTATASAQATDRETMKTAVGVLKGMEQGQSKEWAVATLTRAAGTDSIAYAMNALGIAYMHGIGVEQDSLQATRWLELAGRGGIPDAFHNLGMMYKDAKCGVRQDFARASGYFRQGVEAGSVMCLYDLGYMCYKGLGCRQDYREAVSLFQRGADRDHSPALYMLGLCYRNGYGVEQDTAKASFFLNRAALLSYRPAMEELLREQPENHLPELAGESTVPASMPSIDTEVNDLGLLAGRYLGFLVMYDWSGRYVLGEKPVALSISPAGEQSVGQLVVGNDTVPFRAHFSDKGELVFDEGSLRLGERYIGSGRVPYRMEHARLDVWENSFAGELSLYSLRLKEPERPMFMQLFREGYQSLPTGNGDGASRIGVSPNPFAERFDLAFELEQAAPSVQVRIYDRWGVCLLSSSLGSLSKGSHTVSLSPALPGGLYVLHVSAGRQVLRTIIVKEGGKR